MRVTIAAVGRLKDGPERELFQRYTVRAGAAGRQIAIGPLKVVEVSESRRAGLEERLSEEAAALEDKLPEGAVLITLDASGKGLTSQQLSDLLEKYRDGGTRDLAFALGGPDGLGADIKGRSALLLSFGQITLPHGLARIVLAEQLYRAVAILSGHPYHRG